jgi:hypothetical protein
LHNQLISHSFAGVPLWAGVSLDYSAMDFSRFRNCENVLSIAAMEEGTYRQSRLCRVLRNPVAFTIVCLLAEHKELTPSEIARAAERACRVLVIFWRR